MLPGMANIDRKEQCERRVLALLKEYGLPLPDEVYLDYGDDEVLFAWTDSKVALVVDLEDFDEADANGGYSREGIAA
jgi:hypothetical protein